MNILQLIYLMIPAYVANMAPVFVRKLPWKTPLDFGLSFGKTRIFGDHKTWRGVLSGIIVAVVIGVLLSKVYWPFNFSALHWSFLAGAGTLLGDVVKSFFKRRVNIKPGKPWIPFDQIDYSIGALALGSFIFFPGWINALIIVIISFAGHIAVNHIGYYVGIRNVKW